jgi:hypothetical protein
VLCFSFNSCSKLHIFILGTVEESCGEQSVSDKESEDDSESD